MEEKKHTEKLLSSVFQNRKRDSIRVSVVLIKYINFFIIYLIIYDIISIFKTN